MSEVARRLRLEAIVERMLRDLEEKERIFETYKVASGSNLQFQIRSMIDFIDFEMNRVISFFEGRILKLLNDLFRKDANAAINAIEIDYERIFTSGENEFFKGSNISARTNKESKSEFRSRIRELVDGASQDEDGSPEQRIEHAQRLFQDIFRILMECISEETEQMRTRANTAMDEVQPLNQSIHHSLLNLEEATVPTDNISPSRPALLQMDLDEDSFGTAPLSPKFSNRIMYA